MCTRVGGNPGGSGRIEVAKEGLRARTCVCTYIYIAKKKKRRYSSTYMLMYALFDKPFFLGKKSEVDYTTPFRQRRAHDSHGAFIFYPENVFKYLKENV